MTIFVLCLITIPLIFIWIKFRDKQTVAIQGSCTICDEVFSEAELKEADEKFFCLKDYEIYKNAEWEMVKEIQVTADDNAEATLLQDMKDDLKKQNIPSYIESKYEVEGVTIVTYSKLFKIKKPLN
ncbi:MAG: hypothetical protein CME62_02875 [Halobacteriovoraceae bacterium]|nr:hypothetical protein [Halobacteriovoraceae bacterium]|tara:strand:- start:7340 stop:7717 length:378 start_codon:yes stop_codon:yes gene_type:complete